MPISALPSSGCARDAGRRLRLRRLVVENLDRPDGAERKDEQRGDPDRDHLGEVDLVLGLVSVVVVVTVVCVVAAHGCLYRSDSAR